MTPWRTIAVALVLNSAPFSGPMSRAQAQTAAFTAQTNKATASVAGLNAQTKAATTGGTGLLRAANLLKVGAVGVAAGIYSLFEAVRFEDAFADVRKTIDATEAEFSRLEAGIVSMANRMPVTREEIAGVAAAAGQLGISTGYLLEFTEVAVGLGVATNLSAEDAAMALARLTAVMGTAERDYGRLGSVVVELGNNYATTESEILELSQRLSGAGNIIGASEADVLGLAAAMSSVGIQAELGGGALSRILQGIYADMKEGGLRAEQFAATAGVSAEAFAEAWSTDPVAAFQMVVAGLAETHEAGGNVIAILDALGIKGTQNRQVILRLLGASDLLSESLATARAEWEENDALANEVNERFKTAASQLRMFGNQVTNVARIVGAALIPSLLGVLDAARGLGSWLADLWQRHGPRVVAVWGDLSTAGRHLVDVLTPIHEVGEQATASLAGLGGAAVLGGLEKTAGLLARNQTVTLSLAAAWAALRVKALAAAAATAVLSNATFMTMATRAIGAGRAIGEVSRALVMLPAATNMNALTAGMRNLGVATGITRGQVVSLAATFAAFAIYRGAMWLADQRVESQLLTADIDGLNESLTRLGNGYAVSGEMARAYGADLSILSDRLAGLRAANAEVTGMMAAAPAYAKVADWASTMFGSGDKAKAAEAAIEDLKAAMDGLLEADPIAAANAWKRLQDTLSPEDFAALESEMGLVGQSAKAMGDALDHTWAQVKGSTNLTRKEFESLASKLGLTEAEMATREGAIKIRGHMRDLARDAGARGAQMEEASRKTVEQLEAEGEAWAELADTVAGSWGKQFDMVSGLSGRQTAVEVERGLSDIRATFQEQLDGISSDAENYGARVDEVLADRAEALQDYRDEHSVTGEVITDWYADQRALAESFSGNLSEAFQMGYDPGLISRLLQAGPAEAAPIVEGLVANHSATLVEIVNEGEAALAGLTARAVEMARHVHTATTATSSETAAMLGDAQLISQTLQLFEGGVATMDEVRYATGLTAQRIADVTEAYGIMEVRASAAGERAQAAGNQAAAMSNEMLTTVYRLVDALAGVEGTPAKVMIDGEEFFPTAAEVTAWTDAYDDDSFVAEALLNTGGAQLGFTSLSEWAAWYASLDPEAQALLETGMADDEFNRMFERARRWRLEQMTATLRVAVDEASIAVARARMRALEGEFTGTIGAAAVAGNRWGGVYEFARGGSTEAMALGAGPTLYKWREPETGGEGFVPKNGDPRRSWGVMQTMAGWYGWQVVDPAQVMAARWGGVTAAPNQLAGAAGDATGTVEDQGDEFEAFLADQKAAVEEWTSDVSSAIEAGYDPGTIAAVLEAGPAEAGPVLQRIADDHAARLRSLTGATTAEVDGLGHAAVQSITTTMAQTHAAADTGARRVAQAVTTALQTGATEVGGIARTYTGNLAGAINPVLQAVGQPAVVWRNQGGPIDGPPVDRDVIPAMLTPGEFVTRKSMVNKWGPDAFAALNDGQVPTGWQIPGYNAGGRVTGNTQGLHPVLLARLATWAAAVGQSYNVGSGYRSIAQQQVLYDRWLRRVPGQAQAAPPGSSMHNFGLASDGNHWSGRNPGAFGLRYPMSFEPWHVEPVEARSLRAGGVSSHGYLFEPPPQPPSFPSHPVGATGAGASRHVYDAAVDWMSSLTFDHAAPDLDPSLGAGGGAGAAAAAGWIRAAMAATGVPERWFTGLMTIARRESNFNPRAVNNWDSNARAGDPSRGLMQTIGATFRANMLPGMGDIWNPVHNAVAAIRYILRRYGDISRVQQANPLAPPRGYEDGGLVQFGSYDEGGHLPTGLSLAWNGTGRPEPVGHHLTPADRKVQVDVSLAIEARVFIGDREITDIARVEAETVVAKDHRRTATLARAGRRFDG